MEIHVSDLKSYRACRRKWDWSSRLRKNLEPSMPYEPFFIGKAVHAALEFFYRDDMPFEESLDEYLETEWHSLEKLGELWPLELQALEESIKEIRKMLLHYRMWAASDSKPYADKNLEFLDMEVSFELPFPGLPKHTYAGRFDGLVRNTQTGEHWIFETKTSRSPESYIETLANDEQARLYLWAANQILDYPVVGVLYNFLGKRTPRNPKVLKSGMLSKNKRVSTSAAWYYSAAIAHHPNWTRNQINRQYGDILEKLAAKESRFFLRYPLRVAEAEITNLLKAVRKVAIEMTDPDIPVYPAPHWLACKSCLFRGPCLTMNAGGDYQALLDVEFQLRTGHESMRKEVEEDG